MNVRLGINAGFATNRYPEADDWARIVGEELGLHSVMFVADLLSMFYPDEIVSEEVQKINSLKRQYDFSVDSIFPAAFTRVNHVCHPNPKIREQWVEYLMRLARTGAALGARMMGGHFGIMAVRDYKDESRREKMTSIAIENWHRIAEVGKEEGLECLIFEPMSVPREFACTIDSTHELLDRVNQGIAIPMRLCLDVDHGYSGSGNPRDIDPYAWLREFARVAPVVHIKQSSSDKSGHWPFTPEYNEKGIIRPEKVRAALEKGGAEDVVLAFEFSWRERYPTDDRVVSDLKQSVAYWREYVKE